MSTSVDGSPRLFIDINDILHNYRYIKNLYPESVAAAVVKANSYGMDQPVIQALNACGCQDFFVANSQEAITTRSLVDTESRIYILHGLVEGDLTLYAQHTLIPTLNTQDDVQRWYHWGKMHETPPAACIHIDTGMNRLGLSAEELSEVATCFQSMNIIYVISHLPCGRHTRSRRNRLQLDLFLKRTNTYLPGVKRSIAASSILTLTPEYALDMTRQGLNLYGAYAPEDLSRNPLRFALKLQARILQVRHLNPGDTVGYNATYIAKKSRRLAIIGIGYADGIPYALSNKGDCLIGAHKAPIVGAVSMDLTAIDVTDIPDNISRVHDWVDLFRDNMSLYALAEKAGSQQHEMLSRLSTRCKRHYIS